ncbi:MAG: Tfp pilus assembly protein FimT/FimU [Amphiplicatus sp.]
MPTSIRTDRGFTLVELLVALAVSALGALIVGAFISARTPRLLVDRTADELVVDLKRLRLVAETSGEPARLIATARGYSARAAGIDRTFPGAVSVEWNGAREGVIEMAAGLHQQGALIHIAVRGADAFVEITPITGKIRRGQ